MLTGTGKIDVDFSLAIHNRTGKYFIGRDILRDNADSIGAVFYGRLKSARLPSYLPGRLAGRLMGAELMRRARGKPGLPPVRRKAPVLHLDPLTALNYAVSPRDLVLVHDVGPITHPELFEPIVSELYRAAYEHIAAHRPSLVFVSQASRSAFIDRYAFDGVTHIIYPPLRPELGEASAPVAGIDRPFLLTVGSIGARKGQEASINAYALSGLHERGIGYVICGGPEEPGYAAAAAAADRTPGVVRLSYVSDQELCWLYRQAEGFVLASRLEGFGVPVAEAIAYGLIPAVSGKSVLIEVAGEGALSFDPLDEADIAAAMRRLIDMSQEERRRRIDLLSKQIGQFSRGQFKAAWGGLIEKLRII